MLWFLDNLITQILLRLCRYIWYLFIYLHFSIRWKWYIYFQLQQVRSWLCHWRIIQWCIVTIWKMHYMAPIRLYNDTFNSRSGCTNAEVTFRKGPSQVCRIENLSEFREFAWIWESSLWQSHSNRVPSVHLQNPSPCRLWWTPADRQPNLPDFGLAPSGEHNKFGWTSRRWDGPRLNACSMGKFIFLRKLRARCQWGAKWKCDEVWAIPKFWQNSYQSSHEFTDSSPDLPVFLVAQATFTYTLSKCDWGINQYNHLCIISRWQSQHQIHWTLFE